MRQATTVSEELIAKIGAGLDELPIEPTSRQQLSLLLDRLGERIRSAQARGASYVEIARQITSSGYPIKPGTLRSGIGRHRDKAAGASASECPKRKRAPSSTRAE
jgi:hypothetical protein